MSDSVSEKSETCEKFEIESDHSDKFDSEKNWKPTSVEEWFESNGRRAKAQQKIKVLNYSKAQIFHEKNLTNSYVNFGQNRLPIPKKYLTSLSDFS